MPTYALTHNNIRHLARRLPVSGGYHPVHQMTGSGFGSLLSGLFRGGLKALTRLFTRSGAKAIGKQLVRTTLDTGKKAVQSALTPENVGKATSTVASSIVSDLIAKRDPTTQESKTSGEIQKLLRQGRQHVQKEFVKPTQANLSASAREVASNLRSDGFRNALNIGSGLYPLGVRELHGRGLIPLGN